MKHLAPLMAILLMIVASCSGTQPPQVHKELNSVYYWKTVFHFDSADIAFIKKHDIERIYLRLFDVSEDTYAHALDERTVPNDSVRIDWPDNYLLEDSLSDKEFVPVVYVTLNALKAMEEYRLTFDIKEIISQFNQVCNYE